MFEWENNGLFWDKYDKKTLYMSTHSLKYEPWENEKCGLSPVCVSICTFESFTLSECFLARTAWKQSSPVSPSSTMGICILHTHWNGCVSMRFLKLQPWENVFLHTLHSCDPSPVWISMCPFKCPLWANVFLHILHSCDPSPVWISTCPFKCPLYVFLHTLHSYGLSLVCVRMCVFKLQSWENVFLHTLQSYGFSPVCVLMCFFKFLPRMRNTDAFVS
jgi:hypothetical protein